MEYYILTGAYILIIAMILRILFSVKIKRGAKLK